MARWEMCLVATFFGALFSGCSTTQAIKSPRLADAGVTRVGVVIAEARVIDLSAGGTLEVNLKETERCAPRVEAAAVRRLADLGYEAVPLGYDDEIREVVTAYLRARGRLVVLWAREESIDSAPAVPGAEKVAAARGVDAIAFVSSRIVDPTTKSVIGLAFLGIKPKGELEVSLALVDAAGSVVYFNRRWESTAGSPWAYPEKFYGRLCKELVEDLPGRRP